MQGLFCLFTPSHTQSMNPPDPLAQFIAMLSESITAQEFVRLTLGKYRGKTEGLTKIVARSVQLKSGLNLSLTDGYKTKEVVKNYPIDTGIAHLQTLIGSEFLSARLFTLNQDIQLEYSKTGQAKITRLKPTYPNPDSSLPQAHDHAKHRSVQAAHNPYLTALGITNKAGNIVRTMEDKFRQINKFVEIIQGLVASSSLAARPAFAVVDMGSGKGYLTFALYDFLNNILNKEVTIVGIESRPELVAFCNTVATSVAFKHLCFEPGNISNYTNRPADITIALHACDTATDDAIYSGIQAGSTLIILSPCCHKQIRKAIHPTKSLKSLLKFGILLERQAEIITDGLRALLLELSGYETKVFEFIAPEHTSKNLMIVGTKTDRPVDRERILGEIKAIKELYAIDFHYLETRLFPSSVLSPDLANQI
jgi:16S rRNA G527 N7-methylase RsmG